MENNVFTTTERDSTNTVTDVYMLQFMNQILQPLKVYECVPYLGIVPLRVHH